MKNTNDRWWGKSLIHDLDEMDTVPEIGCDNEKEGLAFSLSDLLKDLDYFTYAKYMKTGDHEIDPVRRIYTELMIPEKRQELTEYLTEFSQTEHGDRITDMITSLQALDREETKSSLGRSKEGNVSTRHPSSRNTR